MDLFEDTILEIISYLSGTEILALGAVSTQLAIACDYPTVWLGKIRQEFPNIPPQPNPRQHYRDLCLERTQAKWDLLDQTTYHYKGRSSDPLDYVWTLNWLYLDDGRMPLETKYYPSLDMCEVQPSVGIFPPSNIFRTRHTNTIIVRRQRGGPDVIFTGNNGRGTLVDKLDAIEAIQRLLAEGYRPITPSIIRYGDARRYRDLGLIEIL